jgi:hypothetical protein
MWCCCAIATSSEVTRSSICPVDRSLRPSAVSVICGRGPSASRRTSRALELVACSAGASSAVCSAPRYFCACARTCATYQEAWLYAKIARS